MLPSLVLRTTVLVNGDSS